MKLASILSVIVTSVLIAFLVMKGFPMYRDVEAVAHRAQVAADVPDMLEYMQTLKAGLERHGMTSGHTALFFATPANDLTYLNESVNQIIARLEAVKDLPRSETTYQVALDDIRGTIRELEAPSMGFLWVQYWFVFLAIFGILAWPIVILFRDDFY